MKRRTFAFHFLVALVLVLNASFCNAAERKLQCTSHGLVKGVLCDVSLLVLLSNPEKYDGETVRVVGFLSMSAFGDLIFANSESAEIADVASSLIVKNPSPSLIESMLAQNKRSVLIIGQFRAEKSAVMNGRLVGGTLSSVLSIQPLMVPWGLQPAEQRDGSNEIQ